MPPAVVAVGAAAVGAGAGMWGASKSAKAQTKAANLAADTSLQTAQMNNALQREIYGQNQAILNPYVTRGNEAGSAINSLLGISGSVPSTPPLAAPGAAAPGAAPAGYTGPPMSEILSYKNDGIPGNYEAAMAKYQAAQAAPPVAAAPAAPAGTVTAAPAPAAGNAQSAFQNYLNSTGYQFQMDQGTQAINQNYAANGALQSGAAMKAIQTYGQNTGKSFFNDYLGLLANQQGVGLSGANAIAGVGTNYANSVSANNNNAANGAINAMGQVANAKTGLYGAVAGGIGSVANAFGSSYGKPY